MVAVARRARGWARELCGRRRVGGTGLKKTRDGVWGGAEAERRGGHGRAEVCRVEGAEDGATEGRAVGWAGGGAWAGPSGGTSAGRGANQGGRWADVRAGH